MEILSSSFALSSVVNILVPFTSIFTVRDQVR